MRLTVTSAITATFVAVAAVLVWWLVWSPAIVERTFSGAVLTHGTSPSIDLSSYNPFHTLQTSISQPLSYTNMSDPSSHANNNEVRVKHFHLSLTADFEKSILSGHVDIDAEVVADSADHIIFDVKDLNLKSIQNAADSSDLEFKVGETHEALGAPLTVTLPADSRSKGSISKIRITYETTPNSSAIQWLPPSQTAGKEHPYLFTQCQAIHARSMLPCQDSPSGKCTYSADVTVPAPLVALMSALQDGESAAADGKSITYKFNQPVPMCSYLVALAIGKLEKRDIGPRTSVWSEKEHVEAGAFEFADTEKFIVAAEEIAGPYVWGRYDILLLPPSFPYGGMENPCLTFVTPTLLAGDRSLANVVAHEIAHSWMGNLVSPRSWEHFWMNEGFTVFLERKIIKSIFGGEEQHLHATIGAKALHDSIDFFGHDNHYTCLVHKLDGVDPDDAFSSVPYEKGFNFLFYLEGLVGGEEVMNPFLKAHCEKYKFGLTDSADWKIFFLDYMKDRVSDEVLSQIDWDAWYNKPGMPTVVNTFDRTLVETAESLAEEIFSGKTAPTSSQLEGWSSNQVVLFLEKIQKLQKAASTEDEKERERIATTLKALDDTFDFTHSKNSEIRHRWYQAAIRAELEFVFPAVISFLKEQGRMKFVRPLYRDLFASVKGKDLAVSTFKEWKANYHLIAQKMVAKDLGL